MKLKKIMLLLLFCMTISIFKCRSFAETIQDLTKPLVIKLGSDYTDYVNYDGFTIITNTINVNVEGKYQLVYANNTTFEEYYKDVYVTNQDTFYFENKVEEHIDNTYKFELIDSVLFNDENYNLVKFTGGRYKTNNYVLSSGGKSTTVRLNTKLEMTDVEANEKEIFMLGTGYNDMNNDPDLHYAIYNNQVSFNKVESSDPEYASCITGNDRYIFIGGYTNKATDLFPEEKNLDDAFLIVIDRISNEIISKKVFTSLSNDYIVDLKFKDNYLYAILENETNNFKIVKLDIFGNVVKEKEYQFKYGYNCPTFKLTQNQLFLNYYYYDYNYLDDCEVVELVDHELESKEVYFNYNDKYILIDFDLVEGNRFEFLYGYRNGLNGYMVKIVENKEVLLEKKVNSNLIPLSINKGFITGAYNESVVVNEFNTLILQKKPENVIDPRENINQILDYKFLINGKEVKHSEKSDLTYDQSLFGKYSLNYFFNNYFDYLYTNKIEVLPFVGVEPSKKYDLGITLDGNAIVRINGERIQLPYKIEEDGVYKIELLGQNNAFIDFEIEVTELSDVLNIGQTDKELELEFSKNQIVTNSTVDFIPNKEIKKNKKNYFYMYLIPVLTGCIGYLIIKRD